MNGIRIDRTAPATTPTVSPGAGYWHRGPVEVTLEAHDNLSGIGASYYSLDGGDAQAYDGPISIGTEGPHTRTYWSVDGAGNVEEHGEAHSVSVGIDTVAPTASFSVQPGVLYVNVDVPSQLTCLMGLHLVGLEQDQVSGPPTGEHCQCQVRS